MGSSRESSIGPRPVRGPMPRALRIAAPRGARPHLATRSEGPEAARRSRPPPSRGLPQAVRPGTGTRPRARRRRARDRRTLGASAPRIGSRSSRPGGRFGEDGEREGVLRHADADRRAIVPRSHPPLAPSGEARSSRPPARRARQGAPRDRRRTPRPPQRPPRVPARQRHVAGATLGPEQPGGRAGRGPRPDPVDGVRRQDDQPPGEGGLGRLGHGSRLPTTRASRAGVPSTNRSRPARSRSTIGRRRTTPHHVGDIPAAILGDLHREPPPGRSAFAASAASRS